MYLIAGTYTPIVLCSIRHRFILGLDDLCCCLGCTVLGIILNAIDIESNEKFSMICYLAMGWCIIFKFNLLPEAIGYNGIWLLVAGGVAYTIGTVFYGLQNKYRYMHSIWHLWILLGSVLHFLCIILYVI